MSLKRSTEQDIIDGCKKPDPEYQKLLVMRYSGLLMTVCRRYSRDAETAKDILQESLIKILHAIGNYENRGSFEAWMRRITINTALKYFDKNCFKNETFTVDGMDEKIVPPEVYAHMGAEELMKLIGELPDGFREVFNLFAIEGYSHKEIGELLGIGESTSRSQLTRARSLLQKQITVRGKIRIRI